MTSMASTVEQAITERYIRRTQRSRRQDQEAQHYLPGGDSRIATYYAPYPAYMVRGEGCYLYDTDGNRYIDFLNNYTSLVHGHAHPAIVEAAADQMTRGTVFGAAAERQVELAKLLCQRVESVDLIRFTNSGTEATLMAMRAARAFTGRDIIVKMDGGYHGSHDFVEVNVWPDVNASGPPQPRVEGRGIPAAVLNAVMVAPFNDLEAMEQILRQHAEKIAAIIVEPIPNAAGMVPPEAGYLPGLRHLASKYGVLLIFDEIVTFRLHTGGMQAIEGAAPDLTALGKIIGGGFPVGAFGGRRDIMEHFNPRHPQFVLHSGTFNGNNMTMVAGLTAMEHLNQAAIDRINRLGDRLREGITQAYRRVGIRGQAIGCGSLLQLHWTDRPIRSPKDAAKGAREAGKLRDLLHLELLNRGIYAGPRGVMCTSTAMTENEIEQAVTVFEEALTVLKPYAAEAAPHVIVG